MNIGGRRSSGLIQVNPRSGPVFYSKFMHTPVRSGNRCGDVTASGNITIGLPDVRLGGLLSVPPEAGGIVVFVHGSGSSRFSPRNRFVARLLNASGLATLLFDLLTAEEQQEDELTARLRFDLDLLGDRTTQTLDWLAQQEQLARLPVGLFGASTGAAAALRAAADRPRQVFAVVSRGGRPDLALDVVPEVSAPVLLIVGELDVPVIEMNRHAAAAMQCECRLEIVAGATHLFEEPGTLETAAALARDWFINHLPERRAAGAAGVHAP
jgi:putative phosphoribosyl transferase